MSAATTAVQSDMEDSMCIMPLGGGQEVGRSSILLQFRGRNIMLDCGSHPGREGNDSLPFFDSLDDPGDIDLILITHFHIDHCAALPYFTEKTNFKGRIFMTHATKAVMKMLLSDNIKLQTRTRPLYSEQELQSCVDKIEVVDYHQTIEHRGVRFTPTAAGHVLGAAMFSIEIDGIRVLYTGDYSMEEDRHLMCAEVPPGGPPDVLIVESTFGVVTLPARADREARFTATVEDIVTRGGSCLIPVFALGRAQELLLILDEYWQTHPELQEIPVFYASKLASKALRVYQTFVNMMNEHIRGLMDVSNPFKLTHIKNMLRSDFDTVGPCVVMAAPGFMQTGVSRHLFERWCDDERNGVVLAGYTVEGTLAHDLLNHPTEIVCQDNRVKLRRCQIEFISFSAHVDYAQNSAFIRTVLPDNIILVHGERTGMKRLKDELERDIKRSWPSAHKPSVAMPDNGIKVKLRFNKPILADIVGEAARNILQSINDAPIMSGVGNVSSIHLPASSVLVSENFTSKIVEASELNSFTSCRLGKITQRLVIPVPLEVLEMLNMFKSLPDHGSDSRNFSSPLLQMLLPHFEEIFDEIEIETVNCNTSKKTDFKSEYLDNSIETEMHSENYGNGRRIRYCIQGVVTVSEGESSSTIDRSLESRTVAAIIIEWKSSPTGDMVADCAVGATLQAFSAPNILRYSAIALTTSNNHENGIQDIMDMEVTSTFVEEKEEIEVVKEVELSDLDLMLQSVGEELKISAERKELEIGEKVSPNTEIKRNLKEIPGGLWTKGIGRRKRCRHNLDAKNNNSKMVTCDKNCEEEFDQLKPEVDGEIVELDVNSDKESRIDSQIIEEKMKIRDEVLKRMKSGIFDPSKSLSECALSLSKSIWVNNGDANSNTNTNNDTSGTTKLKRLLQLILIADNSRLNSKGEKEKVFESVKMNNDNTKIIFRSNDKNGFEAYCYIVWGDENKSDDNNENETRTISNANNGDRSGEHNAVVQSDNDGFRMTVIQAMKSIV